MNSSNHIIKFADDTTVVGLISRNDESAYREEVQRTRRDHSPLHIDGSTVEIVKSTKFLGVHLAEDLTWSLNTSTITKKAQQRLYFLRRLWKAHLPPPILTTFYRGTIESILSSGLETVHKRVLEKRPEDFKKDGKIYRLRTQEDSEDDNNTWNGNSTQQM
ncbi:hypothetical protein NFI96_030875 [Prochilodus magdalenae]|nr:hypothetical protein NFI96_030875 [Prochilodus magdalenae]